MPPKRARQRGFTYIGLIVLVAIVGLVGAATVKVNAMMQRAAAEEELLWIGAAFSDALQSYAAASQPGQIPHPPTLQDLLRDPRFPGVRRHLRKVFVDPMTGKAEWGVQYLNGESGVIAVYSLSGARPFKLGNFDARFHGFEGRDKISDWKFTKDGQVVPPPPPPLVPPGGAPPGAPPGVPVAPQAMPPAVEPAPAPQAEPAPEPEPVPEPPPEPEPEPEPNPDAEPQAEPMVAPPADPDGDPAGEPLVAPPPPPPPPPGKRKGS